MKSEGMSKARQVLADIVDAARDDDAPTALTEYGRPRAVVVSTRFYERAHGDGELARLLWERDPALFDELSRAVPKVTVRELITA